MKRSKIEGIVATILVHAALVLFLMLYTLSVPKAEEESGVPVIMGNTELAQGDADPYTLTEVDIQSQPEPQPQESQPDPTPVAEKPLITQHDEPSIKVKEEKVKKKEEAKKEVKKTEKTKDTPKTQVKAQTKTKEQTEAEKRAAAEQAAAQAAASKIAGAFGKGSKMGSKGDAQSGTGIQGSPTGNGATGKTTGVGGVGTFDLNGRSLEPGGLPSPVYNVQDEGRVVVTIVVNPQGQVVSASINKRTNTVNPSLRKAALDAAKKARFNTVSGVDNQSGTITYYFKLK